MLLKKITITNFRGINGTVALDFKDFNCIVGQNDAGKSTILKAIDAFINDNGPSRSDYNVNAENNIISIELQFDCLKKSYYLAEEIPTTLEQEELINPDGYLQIKKTWGITETNIQKPKVSIIRKKYLQDDFVFKTETQLTTQCKANNIETTKGNSDTFNNVEKRQKLRRHYKVQNFDFSYAVEDMPTTGTAKQKLVWDAIKKILPNFQYFKADTSLSDTDSTIQKYFKDKALQLIEEEIDPADIENVITTQLGAILSRVTDKINQVVKSDEKVEPKIQFDWSKLITTSFVSTSSGSDIPLSSRGDGFRRITMMSYFEYLAETQKTSDEHPIIFGFEEPETFLHPSAQEYLCEKLHSLSENGYQVIISTHSATIVGNTKSDTLTHVFKIDGEYNITQGHVDYKAIAMDLGIKPDHIFSPLFSTSRFLLLVEGIDDVRAMHHLAKLYKENDLIPNTFEELGINVIPIGGCGGVKHWVNLDLFTKLEKPYLIFLDSDKDNHETVSKNLTNLLNYGLEEFQHFSITKKRSLENYIHPTVLERLVPGITIDYSDYDQVKNICAAYPNEILRGHIGGKNVAEKHFCNQTFEDVRQTWFDGTNDEFLELYSLITGKLN